jgi:DNA-binding response OmpR family regulator
MNVVVVEKSQRTIDLLRRALKLLGHSVTGASSAAELQRLMASVPGSHIDAVMIEHAQSDSEAVDLFRAIRRWNPRCPVVLMTACMPRDVSPALIAGADAVLERPFVLEELDETLRRARVRSAADPRGEAT